MSREQEAVEDFRRAMAAEGIVYSGEIIADGKLHRCHVDGDKKGAINGWYVLHLDEKPAGAFGCNKRYGKDGRFTWTMKGAKPLSAEERRQFREKMEAQRKQRELAETARRETAAQRAQAIWDASKECTGHPYLRRKGVASHGLRWGRWEKVDQETGEVRLVSDKALLIPIWGRGKRIWSLQAIFPTALYGGRDKDYLKDGAKEGLFFSIGKPVSIERDGNLVRVIVICEGYATGASIHEATGHACIIAFDAGNLEPVGKTIREAFPDALLLYAADNDQWTLEPLENPGVHYARKAAKATGGLVAIPQFDADAEGKPTDFNDLAQRQGPDAVKLAIAEALEPPAAPIAEPTDEEPPPWDEPGGEAPAESESRPGVGKAPAPPPPDEDEDERPENNTHFAVLGYDHETYYIFNHGARQIFTVGKGQFTENGLIELAPLNWWEMHFPGEKKRIDTGMAANFIIRTAHKRGIYDVSRIRGRGAWVDAGRMVYHHGAKLSVDGVTTDITKLTSRYVYELAQDLPEPHDEAMPSDEGEEILEMASQFRWTKPGSAALLAGWVALAPLCGALRWRPHIWLTGGPGCGKSTVLNDFVHYLLGGLDVFAQGNSSEAGIRQKLKADARPVLFDESEQNNEREQSRIQSVIALIRQASTESEAQTFKGSAGGDVMSFHIRSMFCLASIQVGLKQQADVERLAVLSLRPKREETNAAESWRKLSAALGRLRADPTTPARMFRRSLNLLPTTLKNISVFTEAASERFNSVRDGDQYGTLLAGAWSLISTEVATKAQAFELIDRYDWSEHRENNDMDDGQRALSALLESHIRTAGGIEATVYELICAASGLHTALGGVDQEKAEAFLERHGMKIHKGRLVLSNTSNELKRLMQGTQFEADLRGVLLRVEGADRNDNKTLQFNGVASKCITLPLEPILKAAGGVAPF
jgi:putative DNA primase/helicase